MNLPPQVLYFLLCIFVGWLGDRSRFGFWGSFLGAVFLHPIVAMAALLLVAKIEGAASPATPAPDA
jgi:hypothetical protein